MASERINIWSENTPQRIGVTPLSYTVLDNNYENISHKPSINGVTLEGNKTTKDLKLDTETAKLNKKIDNLEDSLSTIAKTGKYPDASELPSINGVTLIGNKTSEDLHIEGGGGGEAKWGEITGQLNDQTDLKNALDTKVPTSRTINGKALTSNITLTAEDIGVEEGGYNAIWAIFEETATQQDMDDLIDAIENGLSIYGYADGYRVECVSSYVDSGIIHLSFVDLSSEHHYQDDDSVYFSLMESAINYSTGAITSNFVNFDSYNFATKSALNQKQDIINSTHKLSSDLVDDTNHTNKFVTTSDITNWNGKADASHFVTLTQAEYDALATKDLNTYYFIEEQ